MYYVFLYALLYLYCLCCCSVLFYKQPFFLHFEISSPIYKNMEFVSILRFPWLFINSIWFGIYFMWSWWTLILAPCSGTLFILYTRLFLIVLQFFDRQRLFTTIFNPTRLANGEGSTLGTLIFDIELVSLRH